MKKITQSKNKSNAKAKSHSNVVLARINVARRYSQGKAATPRPKR